MEPADYTTMMEPVVFITMLEEEADRLTPRGGPDGGFPDGVYALVGRMKRRLATERRGEGD